MRTLLATALALTLIGHGAALAQTVPPQTQRPPSAQPAPPQAPQKPPATKPAVPGPVVPTEPGFTIGPEDVLGIFVWREAEVSGDVTVRPDARGYGRHDR